MPEPDIGCGSTDKSHCLTVSLPHCEKSNLGQHILAEAPHVGEDGVGGVAAEAEIDGEDAEIAQRPEIARDRRVVAGAQPPVAGISISASALRWMSPSECASVVRTR